MQPPGKLIHFDIDPSVLGKNYAADLPVVSDAASFVASLLPHLTARSVDESLRRDIRSGHEKVRQGWTTPDNSEGVYPPHLLETVQELVGNCLLYTSDAADE